MDHSLLRYRKRYHPGYSIPNSRAAPEEPLGERDEAGVGVGAGASDATARSPRTRSGLNSPMTVDSEERVAEEEEGER